MQSTRALSRKVGTISPPLSDITLHQYLRNRSKEIHKTAYEIYRKEGMIPSTGTYAAIIGAVTVLDGMEYLGKKYPPIIVKDRFGNDS